MGGFGWGPKRVSEEKVHVLFSVPIAFLGVVSPHLPGEIFTAASVICSRFQ